MRLPLTGRAYQERSLIASTLATVNLYAEINVDDSQAPVPVTYYQTPGHVLFTKDITNVNKVRCNYRTSIGTAYTVIGTTVYFVNANQTLSVVGFVADRPSQIYMADNGLAVVLVDGVNGYAIDIVTNDFGQIIDPAFYGADFVVFQDTFFCFNRPGTNQFYISLSQANFGMLTNTAIATGTLTAAGAGYVDATYENVPLTGGSGIDATANIVVTGGAVSNFTLGNPGVGYMIGDALSVDAANLGGSGSGLIWTVDTLANAFDPLDIAAKSGSGDPIVALLSIHNELWLIGALTTEVWVGTGAADFYFQRVQGAFIEHGCIAPYSASNQDVLGFWLMQDKQGKNIVVEVSGYDVDEISTPYLVETFNKYVTTSDAIGFCFQISGHAFYCLIFPQANKTWLYSLKSKNWSEWNWYQADTGVLNRHRANCCMYVFGKLIIGDWENGKLYELSSELYTDDGTPIIRIKTFPHMVANFDRIIFNSFDADMEVGTADPASEAPEDTVALSWSDDRGKTFGFPVEQGFGRGGEFLTVISWNRLGYARDRIFKLQWSAAIKTALNGAFVETKKARS